MENINNTRKYTIWDNGEFAASFIVGEKENVLSVLEEQLFSLFSLNAYPTWRSAIIEGNVAMFWSCDDGERVELERSENSNHFYLYHASERFNRRGGYDIVCQETHDTLHVDCSASEAKKKALIYAEEERENAGWNQRYDIVNSITGEVIDSVPASYDLANADFSVRTFNVLVRAGIRTRKQLLGLSFNDMRKIRNMGLKSIREVLNYLVENGQAIETM